jgi:hypothetical protein
MLECPGFLREPALDPIGGGNDNRALDQPHRRRKPRVCTCWLFRLGRPLVPVASRYGASLSILHSPRPSRL